MYLSPQQLNRFLFFKLPSAFWCGVRVKSITREFSEVTIKYRWFNQNPFRSIYFAVLAMAAELTTGALVMLHIRLSDKNISMLVSQNKAVFLKKAKGRIVFRCNEGIEVMDYIRKAVETGEGQTFWMNSVGINEKGETVCKMHFEWTIKMRNP